ncbi:MAG: hypothetical protein J7M21_00895 [Planctomycetes bacterium]|nr:hypothetical protein [Planctomycetota bacterium]
MRIESVCRAWDKVDCLARGAKTSLLRGEIAAGLAGNARDTFIPPL